MYLNILKLVVEYYQSTKIPNIDDFSEIRNGG